MRLIQAYWCMRQHSPAAMGNYPYLILDARYEKVREAGVIRSVKITNCIAACFFGAIHCQIRTLDNFIRFCLVIQEQHHADA